MNPTVRGIGIRAIVLIIGLVLVGLWLVSIAMKIAGAAIHLLLWVGLALVVVGGVTYLVRRLKRRV
jgi:hypothetical protein